MKFFKINVSAVSVMIMALMIGPVSYSAIAGKDDLMLVDSELSESKQLGAKNHLIGKTILTPDEMLRDYNFTQGLQANDYNFVDFIANNHRELLDNEFIKNLTESANAGNTMAQYNLGSLYLLGKGVEKSHTKAFPYFMRAAEKENAEAQFALGAMYELGWGGLTPSAQTALSWYEKASNQGHASAKCRIGMLYLTGTQGFEKNMDLAIKYLKESASKGYEEANKFLLSTYCRTGDMESACKLFDEYFKDQDYIKNDLKGYSSSEKYLEDRYVKAIYHY